MIRNAAAHLRRARPRSPTLPLCSPTPQHLRRRPWPARLPPSGNPMVGDMIPNGAARPCRTAPQCPCRVAHLRSPTRRLLRQLLLPHPWPPRLPPSGSPMAEDIIRNSAAHPCRAARLRRAARLQSLTLPPRWQRLLGCPCRVPQSGSPMAEDMIRKAVAHPYRARLRNLMLLLRSPTPQRLLWRQRPARLPPSGSHMVEDMIRNGAVHLRSPTQSLLLRP